MQATICDSRVTGLRSAPVSGRQQHSLEQPQQRVFGLRQTKDRRAQSLVRQVASEPLSSVGTNGAGAVPGTPPLDFEELTDIIRLVHDTDIIELELKSKKFSLAVRKREAIEQPEPVIQHVVQAASPVSAPAPVAAAPPPPPAAAAAPPPPAPMPAPPAAPMPHVTAPVVEGLEIVSPMSGTFYSCPAPGEPAFVKEGDTVAKGQTIGIIEAMKLMNEIEAEVSGTVVKVHVQNGTAVTPGQALLVIKPQ